jgi:hypothetical protein
MRGREEDERSQTCYELRFSSQKVNSTRLPSKSRTSTCSLILAFHCCHITMSVPLTANKHEITPQRGRTKPRHRVDSLREKTRGTRSLRSIGDFRNLHRHEC